MNIRPYSAFIVSVILSLLLSKAVTGTDISEIGTSARAISLGRAYSAAESTVDSVFFNPAGLSGIDSFNFTSMYSSLSDDFSYTSLGISLPVKYGVLGFAIANEASGALYRTALDSDGKVITDGSDTFNFTDRVYSLSFAGQMNKELAFGARIKIYEKKAYMIEDGHGSGLSADIGLLYKPHDRISLGLYHENLSGSGISWPTGTRDVLPSRTGAGLKYLARQDLVLMIDAGISSGRPLLFKTGGEWRLHDLVFLRAGLEQTDIGGNKYLNYSLGAGSDLDTFRVDYAYRSDSAFSSNSSHFVSISFDMHKTGVVTEEPAQAVSVEAGVKQPEQLPNEPAMPATRKKEKTVEPPAVPKKDLTDKILKQEELSVRAQINSLNDLIKSARTANDEEKTKELLNKKKEILKRWEETKRSIQNPLEMHIKRSN